MGTPRTKAEQRAEARAFIRASNQRIAEHREAVLRSIAELRRIENILRRRRRWIR
jgi:hypothetical protein